MRVDGGCGRVTAVAVVAVSKTKGAEWWHVGKRGGWVGECGEQRVNHANEVEHIGNLVAQHEIAQLHKRRAAECLLCVGGGWKEPPEYYEPWKSARDHTANDHIYISRTFWCRRTMK